RIKVVTANGSSVKPSYIGQTDKRLDVTARCQAGGFYKLFIFNQLGLKQSIVHGPFYRCGAVSLTRQEPISRSAQATKRTLRWLS
ncbi:MAG: hypothetical protein KKD30_04700, partial [Gammaproteobacteria bacterium]|nr:hypothetical protein [Gammaproteobacteria bacterium]